MQLWQGETLIDEETARLAVKLLMSAAHITMSNVYVFQWKDYTLECGNAQPLPRRILVTNR
ncbi:hypothetical protein ACVXHB_15115 [Escherichia coli]